MIGSKLVLPCDVTDMASLDSVFAEIGKAWGGKYRGQEQVWFLARFHGSDADIDLEAHDPPEFCEFKWVDPSEIEALIVPFKKRVYRKVNEAFRELI